MRQINGSEIGCIKTLISKLNVQDADAMILGYSEMRTSHVSQLTGFEASAVIRDLKKLDPDEAKAENMRKAMIALAYEYHGLSRNASKEEKKEVVGYLKSWVLKYGTTGKSGKHKELDRYTVKELPALVTQFKTVYKENLLKKI